MADAVVAVPVIQSFRTGFAPTVWPINVPKASITRHVLAPTMQLAPVISVPTLHITRHVIAPSFNNFSPATAIVTFNLTKAPRVFYLTKSTVSPA